MNRPCIAHIRVNPDGTHTIQTAANHCRNTARLTAQRLEPLHLSRTAYLTGLLHDMGKFTARFADYIRRAASGQTVHRGSVNHTFSGVRFLLERYHAPTCCSLRDITCELIAYAVGAHHGQFDCIGPTGNSGFLHRLNKADIDYEEARDNFLAQCAGLEELDALFDQAVHEVEALHARLLHSARGEAEGAFLYAMTCRLLLSAVIDGDRRDTAQFMGVPPAPAFPADLRPVWLTLLARVEEKLSHFPADTPIAKARQSISSQCRAFARQGGGIYRLSVPTGAGKTLASLRYALAHAAQEGRARIFFLIPLLSVIEQNAQIIRDYIGDNSLILEHHSNLVRPDGDTVDELIPDELLAENWSAPIVISTLVQFLHTLFLGKTTAIRRMNALSNSVIVIDEVQSVPRPMLTLFNLALNYLWEICGATVVLCSATQPCLETLPHPIHASPQPDMVPPAPALAAVFQRTQVLDRRIPGGYSVEQLVDFVGTCMEHADSLLLICNTKGQAMALYQQLQGCDAQVYHLSTAMCMRHRANTLREVTACLKEGRRVLCVATQLVEAGIDFSFQTVIRVLAGMDNVAQAAGRCNRGGEFGRLCLVYLVNIRGESLHRLPEIRASQIAAEELLASYAQDSTSFGDNLLSDASIRYYYRRLFFNLKEREPDFCLPDLDTTLFDLLSRNCALGAHAPVWREQRYYLNQAFQTAGARFQVFQDHTADVLVPYQEGEALIREFCSQQASTDLAYRKTLLERAKPFTVSLYAYQEQCLAQQGGLRALESVCAVLPGFYSQALGVIPTGNTVDFMEV